MKPEYKLVAKARYMHLVSGLANEIWPEAYAKRYPPKQLAAILAELQSPEAIEEQIDAGMNYFVVLLAGKPVGYFAWEMQSSALHLAHLYLKPEARGRAIGRDIVAYCERLARADGKGRLWCAVHEKSLPVLGFFKELHYRVVQPAPQYAAGYTLPLLELEKQL